MPNTIYNSLSSDLDFDKFQHLFFFLFVIYGIHFGYLIFIKYLTNKDYIKNISFENIMNNTFSIFIIFSLIYFIINGIQISTAKNLSIIMLLGVFHIINIIISNISKNDGFSFISPEFSSNNLFLIISLIILSLFFVNNYLYYGFSYKFILIPLVILSYLISGQIINKNVSGWFIALLPLLMIDLKQKNKIDSFVVSFLSVYIIQSGNLTNFKLYE